MKSQVSIYFIIGILIIIILSVFFFTKPLSIKYQESFGLDVDIKSYIENCILESTKKAIDEKGITNQNIEEFKQIVSTTTKECTSPVFEYLKKRDYNIEEGEIQINAELNEETVIVNIIYFVEVTKNNQRFEFRDFTITFEKTMQVKVPNGVATRDIIIRFKDGKAELKIQEGTRITDKQGNPVEVITFKLKDISSNGYENSVVHSTVVYEGQPDGVKFSKPVQLAIHVNENNLPKQINYYSIARWDNEKKIWRGLPTTYKNGVMYAEISHLSDYSGPVDCNTIQTITKKRIFQQRYKTLDGCSSDDWYVSKYSLKPEEIKIIAVKEKTEYSDFFDINPNILYGYSYFDVNNGYFFKNCLQEESCIDASKDFVVPQRFFLNSLCSNEIVDIKNIQESKDDPCVSKKIGEKCATNKICVLEQDNCVCDYPPSPDEKKLGYCDPRCVGGKLESDYIFSVEYVFGNDCIADDNNEKPYILVSPYECSLGDICSIIGYDSEPYRISINEEEGKGQILVKGIYVYNQNFDACSYGGIKISILGADLDRSYIEKFRVT